MARLNQLTKMAVDQSCNRFQISFIRYLGLSHQQLPYFYFTYNELLKLTIIIHQHFHLLFSIVHYLHSDASYLSVSKAWSRAGGDFFLSDMPTDPTKPPLKPPTSNGPLHRPCQIMRNILASAAKAKIGALFLKGQEALPIRVTLAELGHPQPPTPMQTDNSTAAGFAKDTIKQKRSKAIDMRFYWIKDRVQQKQFLVYWRPGPENLGDYHTKHHSPSHHRTMRPTHLLSRIKLPTQRLARVC
jgi:hypothetical protein